MDEQQTASQIRQSISQHFSIAEIRLLCADLDVEFENLAGDTRDEKALSLVAWMNRRDRLPELATAIKRRQSEDNTQTGRLINAQGDDIKGDKVGGDKFIGNKIIYNLPSSDPNLLANIIQSNPDINQEPENKVRVYEHGVTISALILWGVKKNWRNSMNG